MEQELWNKISQLLAEVRCENQNRKGVCTTKEYQQRCTEKQEQEKMFLRCIDGLPERDKYLIENYLETVEKCNFAECQQSYLQGYIDCLLILCAAGIVIPSEKLYDIIKEI